MANTVAGNVYKVDTNAGFPELTEIVALKTLGATGSTVTISAGSSPGGNMIYFNDTTTTTQVDYVEIRNTEGIYVTLTGTAKVLIYARTRRN